MKNVKIILGGAFLMVGLAGLLPAQRVITGGGMRACQAQCSPSCRPSARAQARVHAVRDVRQCRNVRARTGAYRSYGYVQPRNPQVRYRTRFNGATCNPNTGYNRRGRGRAAFCR